MISLYTPQTGLLDLEAEIAYGLARVALESTESDRITIEPKMGYIEIKIDIPDKDLPLLDTAFATLCLRFLSIEYKMGSVPGVQVRYRPKYCKTLEKEFPKIFGKGSTKLFETYNTPPSPITLTKDWESQNVCKHMSRRTKIPKLFSLILGVSPYVGKPYKRDAVGSTFNVPLCSLCGALGLLGIHSTKISMRLGAPLKGLQAAILPLLTTQIGGNEFSEYLSAIKHFPSRQLPETPFKTIPLMMTALYPHIVEVSQKMGVTLQIELMDTSRGASTRSAITIDPIGIFKFISDNSFNIAIANECIRLTRQNLTDSLINLSSTILARDKGTARRYAISFAREYVRERNLWSNIPLPLLVHTQTTKYILKEVCGVTAEIIDDTNIKALAKMLRFFVRQRKFGYVDNIRNARTFQEFKSATLSALREGRAIYEGGKGDRPYVPKESEIEGVLQLANEKLDDVKVTLALYSLAFGG